MITSTSRKYVTLDEVVRRYMIKNGYQDEAMYQTIALIAVDAARILNMDVRSVLKTLKAIVPSTARLKLPDEFLNYKEIGLLNPNNNRVSTLRENKGIPLSDDLFRKSPFVFTSTNETRGAEGYVPNYQYYGRGFNYYGIGGGQNRNGDYRLDETTNELVFNAEFVNEEVYIEYIPDRIENASDMQVIHVFLQDAVYDYIYWQMLEYDRTIPSNEKERAERRWEKSKKLAASRSKSKSLKEYITILRKNNKQAPKF